MHRVNAGTSDVEFALLGTAGALLIRCGKRANRAGLRRAVDSAWSQPPQTGRRDADALERRHATG